MLTTGQAAEAGEEELNDSLGDGVIITQEFKERCPRELYQPRKWIKSFPSHYVSSDCENDEVCIQKAFKRG